MRATFTVEPMRRAFKLAAQAAPSRSPKPILQNVKLCAKQDGSILIGTDMETAITVGVDGLNVEELGDVLLPKDRFDKILEAATDECMSIASDGQHVTVKGSRTNHTLLTAAAEEYPVPAAFDAANSVEIPSGSLRAIAARTKYAADTESNRFALGGVKIEMGPAGLTAVATDGRRLCCQTFPLATPEVADRVTIVPMRTMQILERTLSDDGGPVHLSVRDNDIMVQCGSVVIYSRLLEGRFPDWRKILSDDVADFTAPVASLLSVIRNAMISASDEVRSVGLKLTSGTLTVSGSEKESGESVAEMPIEYAGVVRETFLKSSFLVDALSCLDPDTIVSVSLGDGETAAQITTEDGYRAVIMPLSRE